LKRYAEITQQPWQQANIQMRWQSKKPTRNWILSQSL